MLLRPDILRILEEKDIKYREFTHEAVFTIDEAESLSIPGFDMSRVPKNLFLQYRYRFPSVFWMNMNSQYRVLLSP